MRCPPSPPPLTLLLAPRPDSDSDSNPDPIPDPDPDPNPNQVVNNLLSGMERIYAQYDHNVEEDEFILAKRDGLSARNRLAVQQRRLSKLVLERQVSE